MKNIINTSLMNDMHLESSKLFQEYYAALSVNDVSTAKNILKQNPSLTNQILIASNINNIISNVNILEENPKSDIDVYLSNLFSVFQQMINDTRAVGVFDTSVQYHIHNMVYYNNYSYYCIKEPPIGTLPTNTEYWNMYDLKGLKGFPGLGVILSYAWNSTVSYPKYAAVVYNNKLYIAKSSNTNKVPTNTTYWWLASSPLSPVQTPIQSEEPVGQRNGDQWFKTW